MCGSSLLEHVPESLAVGTTSGEPHGHANDGNGLCRVEGMACLSAGGVGHVCSLLLWGLWRVQANEAVSPLR